MVLFVAPTVTLHSTVDHLQQADPLHTASELVIHMGKDAAATQAMYYQAQATRLHDDPGARFWGRVSDVICRA